MASFLRRLSLFCSDGHERTVTNFEMGGGGRRGGVQTIFILPPSILSPSFEMDSFFWEGGVESSSRRP